MLLQHYTLCAGRSGAAAAEKSGKEDFPGDAIAVVSLSGVLTRDSWWRGIPTTYLVSLLRDIESSGEYFATILDINSPGGEAPAVPPVLDYLTDTSRTMRVYSSIEMAASAAYWIAAYTDGIYLQNDITAFVGSIGTMMHYENFDPFYEKQGVVIEDIYPDESPLKNAAYRAAQKGDYGPYKKMLSELAVKFQSAVRSRRPEVVDDALKGDIFTGSAGIEAGLADGIMPLTALIEKIQASASLRNTLNNPNIEN